MKKWKKKGDKEKMREEKLRKIINLYREKVNIFGDDLKIIETRNKYLKKVHFNSVLFCC